jgi:hypothetical protein
MHINNFYNCKGHLEIWKIHKSSGDQELVYDEDNVVCSGMGVILAGMFGASGSSDISDFQITLFQLGVSGTAGLQVSSTGRLGSALALAEYGTGDIETASHTLIASGSEYTGEAFGVIDTAYIDKIGETSCRWRIILDENAANRSDSDPGINEIGIFGYNPLQRGTAASYLAAYRTFTAIRKTSDFLLDFRWTITF